MGGTDSGHSQGPRCCGIVLDSFQSRGLGMIAWAGSLHIISAPEGWQLQRTPGYMLRSGPYRFSRNPDVRV